jgi:hypothetical protein
MTGLDIYTMLNWIEFYRTDKVEPRFRNLNDDGTRTFSYYFHSERDAVIFKLRFA